MNLLLWLIGVFMAEPVGLSYADAIAQGWQYNGSTWTAPANPSPTGISYDQAIRYGWAYDPGTQKWTAPGQGFDAQTGGYSGPGASLDEALAAQTPGYTYGQYVNNVTNNEANNGNFTLGQGVGSIAKETAPIWAPALTAGLAPPGTFDAVQPGVFGGQTLAGAAGGAGGSTSLADLLASSTSGDAAGVTPQFLGASADAPIDWSALDAGVSGGTGAGAVAPGVSYALPAAAGAVGLGAAGNAAAGGVGSAAAGSAIKTSNDTPGESTIAPGVVEPGTGASGLGSGAANGAAGTAGGTALSRLLGLDQTGTDLASVLGSVANTGLGIYGANQQADQQTALANQYLGYGAPSRARYEASMSPGFDPMSIPGYSAALDNSSNSILRKLSASGGNPFGNPGALIEANKAVVAGTALPAIQQYQNQNANTGGIGTLTGAAPGASNAAINADQSIYSGLGYGIDQATNPSASNATSLAALLKQYQQKSNPFALA